MLSVLWLCLIGVAAAVCDKMVFVGKPAKSAYLVFWRYANFQKTSWLRISIPRFKIKHRKFSEVFTYLSWLPGRECGSALKSGKYNCSLMLTVGTIRKCSPWTSWVIRLYGHPLTGIGLKAVIISENFQCLILNLRTCSIVIHTIFWKFSKLRLTSPSGPIRYSILISPISFVL